MEIYERSRNDGKGISVQIGRGSVAPSLSGSVRTLKMAHPRCKLACQLALTEVELL
jgi:hypothetical protein